MLTAILFAWGCAALAVMAYYAFQEFPRAYAGNPTEMGMGFLIGLLYGWPAWLGLPIVAAVLRKTQPVRQRVLLLAPVAAGAALTSVALWLGL